MKESARTFAFSEAFPDLRAMNDDGLTLGMVMSVLKRRREIVYATLFTSLLLVTLYALVATRRYQATGQIQIQKESAGAFGLESVMGDVASSADALDYNITLQTEANILMSNALALRVIKDLRLETTKDFYPAENKKQISLPSWLFFWRTPVEPLSVPIDEAPNRRYVVLKSFASHLKVEPVTGTRLIDVRYSNPDPKLAADVVNHLIAALTDYTFQIRFAATAQASSWLATQLDELRRQTESLQAKTIELQRETGMFGSDESHNVVLARLENLNEALAAAESSRILKEAIYRVASSGDAELISGLSGNAGPGAPAGAMANSLGLIQNLRAQEASIKAELDQDRVKYGSAYPRISEAQAELSGIQQSIHDEVRRIGERAHTDYQIAVKAEASAQSEFEKQKKLANALNDKAIAYGLAKQEADSSRDVYEGLLAKLKQAGVLEGLRSTNITVVNPASVPPPNRPKSPNLLLYYTVAIAMGFGLGGILAVVRDLTDAKISSLEDIERAIGAPLMGLIPEIKSRSRSSYLRQVIRISKSVQMIAGEHKSRIATSTYIDSPFTESLRSLRTSLMLSRSGGPPQVLLLTSSTASEGKSTISLNLATVLTQQGARVLLVDADLRRPVLHQRIGVTCTEHGISAVLTSDQNDFLPQQVGGVPNLFVFCGGTPPPFPAELLGSLKMQMLLAQWRQEYDFIVLDGPPLLPVTDAVVLSQQCDAVLMVARHDYTEKRALQRSYQTVSRQLPEHVVLGTVLNAVPSRSSDFYEYYGYRKGTA